MKHLKAIVQYKEEIRTRLQNLYSVGPHREGRVGAVAQGLRPQAQGSPSPNHHHREPHTTPSPTASLQWRGFLDLADGVSEDTLDRVIDSQKPNQCCALVYSLSATGPPKAMMLSHDNVSVPSRGGSWGSGSRLDEGELPGVENRMAYR